MAQLTSAGSNPCAIQARFVRQDRVWLRLPANHFDAIAQHAGSGSGLRRACGCSETDSRSRSDACRVVTNGGLIARVPTARAQQTRVLSKTNRQ
jgi:hypothetical protein